MIGPTTPSFGYAFTNFGNHAQQTHRATPAGQDNLPNTSAATLWQTEDTQEVLSPAQKMQEAECATCEGRRYQDISNDPGVSFQSPQHIDPSQAARTVRAHEMEHVAHSQVQARMQGKEVVSQSVLLHNAICAECGRIYVSGGVTKTSTRDKDPSAFEVGLPDTKEPGLHINSAC